MINYRELNPIVNNAKNMYNNKQVDLVEIGIFIKDLSVEKAIESIEHNPIGSGYSFYKFLLEIQKDIEELNTFSKYARITKHGIVHKLMNQIEEEQQYGKKTEYRMSTYMYVIYMITGHRYGDIKEFFRR